MIGHVRTLLFRTCHVGRCSKVHDWTTVCHPCTLCQLGLLPSGHWLRPITWAAPRPAHVRSRRPAYIAHVTRHFHYGLHRDESGLLHWLNSFADCLATGEQDRLQTTLADAKLPPGNVTIPVLEKHCIDVLTVWTKITGDGISQPASYNARLLSSIPPSSTGHLGSLRAWHADKITRMAPSFSRSPNR